MKTKLLLEKTVAAVVIEDHDRQGGESRWSMSHDQLLSHLPGIDESGHPWSGLSKGDRSAARDAVREHEKKTKGDA